MADPDHQTKNALIQVQTRLIGRFPGLATEVVEAAVRVASADHLHDGQGPGVQRLEQAALERLSAIAPE